MQDRPGLRGLYRSAVFSPDSKVLATATATATVALHDLVNHETRTLDDTNGWTKGAACLAFSPDGATLAVGQEDGRITLWDAATRCNRSTLAGHQEFVAALAYAPDGRALATSGGEGTTRIWDLPAGQERSVITSPKTVYAALAFSRDSSLLCLGCPTSSVVRLWDLTTGVERAALEGATGGVLAVDTSPDSITLAAADNQGTITFWNLATLRVRPKRLTHAGVRALAFTPDSNALATGGFDGTIHLWTFRSPSDDSQALDARAGAGIEDLTLIRWPYTDREHFGEFAAVLALAAGNLPADQTVDFSTATVHVFAEDLTRRATRGHGRAAGSLASKVNKGTFPLIRQN